MEVRYCLEEFEALKDGAHLGRAYFRIAVLRTHFDQVKQLGHWKYLFSASSQYGEFVIASLPETNDDNSSLLQLYVFENFTKLHERESLARYRRGESPGLISEFGCESWWDAV